MMRKGRTTSTSTGSVAERRPTTPSPSDTPPSMYETPPTTSGMNLVSPASFSPAALHVLDEMPTSVDDETFFSFMNDGNFGTGDGQEETFDISQNDYDSSDVKVEVPKKKGEHCSALYKGKPKQQRGKDVDNEDEDSDRARSPTPSSAPSRKRPPGRRGEKERLKKAGESGYKKSLDNMMTTRKEFAAERNEFQITKWMEMKVVEERRMVAEEKRATAEEKRTVFEERRAMVEEKRMVVEKRRAAAAKRRARLRSKRQPLGEEGGGGGSGQETRTNKRSCSWIH